MNFVDLLNLAETSPQISEIAAMVFRYKYSHLQVIVYNDFPHPDETNRWAFEMFGLREKTEEKLPEVYERSIQLKCYDTILKTFKHFGHAIKKFKMAYRSWLRHVQAEIMGNLISEYLSETLVEIEFVHAVEKTLEYITKPLVSVHVVTFAETFEGDSRILPINELYPSLHSLNLEFTTGGGLDYFECHMPYLEHVSIKGITNRHDFTHDGFESMIKKNPQIISLQLYKPSVEFLRKVNTILQQLESLTLKSFRMTEGSIRFENVTTFGMEDWKSSPQGLYFPRIQTLHIVYNGSYFNEWHQFVNEHNRLIQLHLAHKEMTDSQFQQLTANLRNLVEISLCFEGESIGNEVLSANMIAEFVRNHKKLQKIDIINYLGFDEATLQDQLNEKWNIDSIHGGLSFTRKLV